VEHTKLRSYTSVCQDWFEEQLVPILDSQLTLLVLDLFSAHKTQGVLDTFLANDITVSLIPSGSISLVLELTEVDMLEE